MGIVFGLLPLLGLGPSGERIDHAGMMEDQRAHDIRQALTRGQEISQEQAEFMAKYQAQQQFVEAQQRLSNAFALAQLQQPGIARSAASDYSNSAAAMDPALLQYLHQSQGSSQLSQLLMPLPDGRVHNQSGYSLPHLGSLQQNAEMARNQQLLQMHQHLMFQQQAASQQMPTLLPDLLSYYPQLRDSVCLGNAAPQ